MQPSEINLDSVLAEVLAEAKQNKSFAARLLRAAKDGVEGNAKTTSRPSRRRHRRNPAPFDPFEAFQKDEDTLRSELSRVNLEQLRDIVSDFGMDNSRLALKWKDGERLINLIVDSVKSRARKGAVFLTEDYLSDHLEKTALNDPRLAHISVRWKDIEDQINNLVLQGDLSAVPTKPSLDIKLACLRKLSGSNADMIDQLSWLARIRNSAIHGSPILGSTYKEFFVTANEVQNHLNTLTKST